MNGSTLQEVWVKGRFQSDVPSPVRHCVVKVYQQQRKKGKKHRGALSAAFAICMASMQKAGQVKPGTRKLTKRGVGKASARARDKSSKAKDREYERIVSGNVQETKSRGVFNQSGPKRASLGRRRGWDGTITPKPSKGWLTHGAIPKAKKPKRLRRKRYRPGVYDRMGTVFEWMELAEALVRGE